jgi:hypothetical protein
MKPLTRSNAVVVGEIIADVARSEIMPSWKLRLKYCQQGSAVIEARYWRWVPGVLFEY